MTEASDQLSLLRKQLTGFAANLLLVGTYAQQAQLPGAPSCMCLWRDPRLATRFQAHIASRHGVRYVAHVILNSLQYIHSLLLAMLSRVSLQLHVMISSRRHWAPSRHLHTFTFRCALLFCVQLYEQRIGAPSSVDLRTGWCTQLLQCVGLVAAARPKHPIRAMVESNIWCLVLPTHTPAASRSPLIYAADKQLR